MQSFRCKMKVSGWGEKVRNCPLILLLLMSLEAVILGSATLKKKKTYLSHFQECLSAVFFHLLFKHFVIFYYNLKFTLKSSYFFQLLHFPYLFFFFFLIGQWKHFKMWLGIINWTKNWGKKLKIQAVWHFDATFLYHMLKTNCFNE